MTAKTTVCTAVAVLVGVVCSASAGDYYGIETTNGWFAVDAGTADFEDGLWQEPQNGGTARVSQETDAIILDTDLDDPLIYTPAGAGSEVVFVYAHMIVSANELVPSTNGLSEAQAALTTVTNTTNNCLDWYGLVKVNDAAAWVALDGDDHPVAGQAYDVEIALDNRAGQKTIRYSVKTGAAPYTHLTYGGEPWLDNPKTDKTSISAVAFSGVGSVGDFGATNIWDNAPTFDLGEIQGFDFKGGSVTAAVTLASGQYTGKTAVLTVVDFADHTSKSYASAPLASDGTVSFDLTAEQISSLTPGGTYSYTITVKDNDGSTVLGAGSGTFTAANWGSWFSASASGGSSVLYNGAWSNTYLVPEPAVTNETQYAIYGDASFLIDNKEPGSDAVSRVDTKYQFETFVSASALQVLADAVSGIVAATNESGAAWYAYTDAGWQSLAGAPVPAVDTTYILRAEFDFKSSTKRVRYLVSTDDSGATFVPLTLELEQWIDLANQEKTTLSEVSISGKGILTSIYAEVADPSVAVDNAGVRYDTLWGAITSGTQPITLLTNATLSPNEVNGRRKFQILDNGFEVKYDNAASAKWWLHKKDNYWYLMRFGGSYIFQ